MARGIWPQIWDGSIHEMPQSRYLDKLEAEVDFDQIKNSMWTGYISSPLTTLVANAIGSRKKATRVVQEMNAIATDLHTAIWEEKNKILNERNKQRKAKTKLTINAKIRALYAAELGGMIPTKPSRRTRRKAVRLTMQEFLALPTASKEKRYQNIMGQLHVDKQKSLPQKGDYYRSYQTTGEGVICTTGIITKCTGNSTHPYEVTCTGADIRGYIGKTVAAPAVELTERTTKTENKPTQEEENY